MGTFDKIKEGFKKTVDKVEDSAEKDADPDTYKGSKDEKEYRENEKGGSEPLNAEDIVEHEPTAVNRDKNHGTLGDAV